MGFRIFRPLGSVVGRAARLLVAGSKIGASMWPVVRCAGGCVVQGMVKACTVGLKVCLQVNKSAQEGYLELGPLRRSI